MAEAVKQSRKRKPFIFTSKFYVPDFTTGSDVLAGEQKYAIYSDGSSEMLEEVWYIEKGTWQKYLDRFSENITDNLTKYV